MEDSVKIEAIRGILDGLKWYGSEYRYKPKDVKLSKDGTSQWVNPHDYDRDNIDNMIDNISAVVDSGT